MLEMRTAETSSMQQVVNKMSAHQRWLDEQLQRGAAQRFTVTGHPVDHILAKLLLKLNSGNRKISHKHVQSIANSIHLGEWEQTGDTVKISEKGRLLDGQHRLDAISKTNSVVLVDLAFGVADAAQSRIDINLVRTVGNNLQIAGLKNATVLASAARLIKSIEAGLCYVDFSISKPSVYDFCVRDHALQGAAATAASINSKMGLKRLNTGICVGLYLLRNADLHSLNTFLKMVESGANLQDESPILHLRNNLYRGSHNHSRASIEVAAWIIKAYQLWVEGATCRRLAFSPSREKFPVFADARE